MAYYSIEKRPRTDGTVRYRCTVGVKEGGKYIYRENRTFGKLALAKTWGARRVAEIEEVGLPSKGDAESIIIRDLIQKYIDDPNLGGKVGRTKSYVLNMLIDCELSQLALSELTTSHIIDHCRHRNQSGASPSTVNHDVSYLAAVLRSAKPIYGIDYDSNPAYDARPMLTQMGLIGKSQRRSRRPESDELKRLVEGLKERSKHKGSKIPFVDILNFSILSCMRVG